MVDQAPIERQTQQETASNIARSLDGLIALTQETKPSKLLTELLVLAKSEAERQSQDDH